MSLKDLMKIKSIKEELTMTNKANELLKEKLSEFSLKAHEDGFHLSEQPFIPEYLGFEETELKDSSTEAMIARIYTKNGVNLARPVSASEERYTVAFSDGRRVQVLLENMLHAIIVLNAIGIPLNVKDYMAGNYSIEKIFEEK